MTEVVEVVNEVGDVVVSHIASMSSVETRLVAATSPRRKNLPRDEIEEGGEEEQQVPEESEAEKYMAAKEEKEMGKDEMEMGKEEEVTTMSYTELELATPHQEEAPALEMMYETTLKPQVTSSQMFHEDRSESATKWCSSAICPQTSIISVAQVHT